LNSVNRPLIMVTNDDGIASFGLRAAARSALDFAEVWVVAPRIQQSGLGRSFPRGEFSAEERLLDIDGTAVPAVALDTSPAQVVRHGILRFVPRRPDLVISGINYGENLGNCITISGTIGAAIEAASLGIPSLAASLETEGQYHYSADAEIDFVTAASFLRRLVQHVLTQGMPSAVDILKLDVPRNATPRTPWKVTRVSRQGYFVSPVSVDSQGKRQVQSYMREINLNALEPDSDIHAVMVERVVSVSPLTIDLTAPVDMHGLNRTLAQS